MIEKSFFGNSSDGVECTLYKIQNKNRIEVSVINYGAIIQSIKTPDRNGNHANIVLSYDSLEDYIADNLHIGAVAGRYANRIANGRFSIDGKEYKLSQNDRGNHLHGGNKGFNKAIWKGEIVSENCVKLSYESMHGEEGYPGNLRAEVSYTLSDENELHVDFKAVTDKSTVVNLVQHSYFNLTGGQGQLISDHELKVSADSFLPVNDTMIPTGEFRSVENTPFDFRRSKKIKTDININDQQLALGEGYDHCWILNGSTELKPGALLYEPTSGRVMEVFSTMPGLHVYTGNFLKGKFKAREGICLETQYFPDSPNQPKFPSALLHPGDLYQSKTVFKFSVR